MLPACPWFKTSNLISCVLRESVVLVLFSLLTNEAGLYVRKSIRYLVVHHWAYFMRGETFI